jgi:hypothetical protein
MTTRCEHCDSTGWVCEAHDDTHTAAAHAAYDACRLKYPAKLIMLCQGERVLRRSNRTNSMRRISLISINSAGLICIPYLSKPGSS